MENQEELYQDEDFCPLCALERKEKGLAPNLLVVLPNTTSYRSLEVQVCPTCDGSAAQLGTR